MRSAGSSATVLGCRNAPLSVHRAVAIDPDSDAPWFRRKEAYVLRGDIYAEDLQQYDRAAEEYAKALELEPDSADLLKKRDEALQTTE